MRTTATALTILAGTLLLGAGCTRERSRAVEAEAGRAPERDYRGMIDRARERQSSDQLIATVERSIERFQFDLARLPTNLAELVALGYLQEIQLPPEGSAYAYDPVHGNVSLTQVDRDSGVQLPPEMTNENRATLIDVNLPAPR